MKPVLFLAFLALGPALAQQVPLKMTPRQAAGIATTSSAAQVGAADPTAPCDGERSSLCGR